MLDRDLVITSQQATQVFPYAVKVGVSYNPRWISVSPFLCKPVSSFCFIAKKTFFIKKYVLRQTDTINMLLNFVRFLLRTINLSYKIMFFSLNVGLKLTK